MVPIQADSYGSDFAFVMMFSEINRSNEKYK